MALPHPPAATPRKSPPATEAERLLEEYRICRVSRELSNTIRRDVLTGRAKFGVSDDGKELYQIALSRVVKAGDWRADYYRGHTLLLALGIATPEEILAQLYSHPAGDPSSRGRQMGGHYMTPTVRPDGGWVDQLAGFNVSSATSPTAGQVARGLGLAFASRVYRRTEGLDSRGFSNDGNEISWTEIGDASTSEGVFWEAMNAAGVLQVPLVMTVADDGYGISVPVDKQTTKGSISRALAGLAVEEGTNGILIRRVHGWDFPALLRTYREVAELARRDHRPVLVHVDQLTQPNGHSTSGSHERYKSKERLAWEEEWDCLRHFRRWLLAEGHATEGQLADTEAAAKRRVKAARAAAWAALGDPRRAERDRLLTMLPTNGHSNGAFEAYRQELQRAELPLRAELIDATRRLRHRLGGAPLPPALAAWLRDARRELRHQVGDELLSEGDRSPLRVPAVAATYADDAPTPPAYELLQHYFTAKFRERPELFAFGEDVGQIGDVNQGFAGLQKLFGPERIFDTGIREWTIVGQAMGMAMRGLRPIAEIQYLDYVFYALPFLTDDVATLRWRTAGGQRCPLIIRTRGHRLEGIWHSGSYLSPLIGSLRGMHLCVPRNVTEAAGMYNTLLDGDDPAIVIEVLNGYRLREREPNNLTDFRVPLGQPERLRDGEDLTLVTYGACVRICEEAAELLAERGYRAQLFDVRTLLPFDLEQRIANGLRRTNRLLIVDEDVPGGASAYLSQQILEAHGGYRHLDAPPRTLTASAHRPAYADDGNYGSKPQVMDVVDAALELLRF